MKTFEEQFQSVVNDNRNLRMGWEGTGDIWWWDEFLETIKDNCLDKQRVRETIEKIRDKTLNDKWNGDIHSDELLKELEL